ncbi:MAG: 16S rRNA (adenine1518-N6/adenine1519-N6)-dimethyltransferase, partial [Parcubacteria group bacterium Gr01-1014_70]
MGKRLGQHFLTSAAIAKRMAEAAHIQSSDVVLEVGPGKGILTRFLLEKAKRVIAVEKDVNLAIFLRNKFNNVKNLEVVEGDILKISNFQFLISKKFPKKYKIVANLP